MGLRRRLIGPLMLLLGATGHAAEPTAAHAEEPPRPMLRPSFEPSSGDPPREAESGAAAASSAAAKKRASLENSAPSRKIFVSNPPGAAPPPRWFDGVFWQAMAAPLYPADFQRPRVDLDSPTALAGDLDNALRREAADAGLTQYQYYQYLLGVAHMPVWVGAASAADALRRQDNANWRQRSLWAPRNGWEVEYAPAGGVLLGARSYFSPGIDKTLWEAKFGVAVLDDLPFPAWPGAALYMGPFMTADGLRFDGGSKLGAHLTLGQIGAFHLTFAGGFAHDRWGGPGAFALFQSSLRF